MTEQKHELMVRPPAALAWVDAMKPKNLDEVMAMCKLLASCDVVPKDFQGKPGNILIAIGMGTELGLSPFAAVQNIMVVNGRPTMWGDAVLGLVLSRDVLEYFKESAPDVALKQGYGKCELKRKGGEPIVRTFSLAEATKANLWGKAGPWTNYPGRMLQMRARSWALRDSCPDILKGIQLKEEVADYEIVDVKPLPAEPARLAPTAEPVEAKPTETNCKAILNSSPDWQTCEISAVKKTVDAATGRTFYKLCLADGSFHLTDLLSVAEFARDALKAAGGKAISLALDIQFKPTAGEPTSFDVIYVHGAKLPEPVEATQGNLV